MKRRKAIALTTTGLCLPGCRPRMKIPHIPATKKGRYEKSVKKLKASPDAYARWCALGQAATDSLAYGKNIEARAYAEELIKLAPQYKSDWNYGNAIHDSSIILGCLALESGDVSVAKAHLIEAGKSPGSPQLNSFGPSMTLAKALLEAGEKNIVIEYFELCRKFWKNDHGSLDQWQSDIESGRVPDFWSNLD